MNILLLGSGGREHTLAWKMSKSKHCTALYIAPGNAGTSNCGHNVPLDMLDFKSVLAFIKDKEIELVLVGPEQPLVEGIYDYLVKAIPELIIVGPSKTAAQLEGSKSFAKQFMAEFGIPTASYKKFDRHSLASGKAYIQQHSLPIVLKADGLAAGKGVLICQTHQEALDEFEQMLNGKFGVASDTVVVEEFLSGLEFSVFVLTDGKGYSLLPVAKDYKRIGEGDRGLNTGGMGSVSPVDFVDQDLMDKVEKQIIIPTIQGLEKRNFTYKGFIFFGLIHVNGNPYVIEYNCRMGDPETQSVIPRLENDLIELFIKMQQGDLNDYPISTSEQAAASIILVSGGYPAKYEKGKIIYGLEEATESLIFHAGTKQEAGAVQTNGGRVLSVSTLAPTLKAAIKQSNIYAEKIQFEGKYYRKDIGFDLGLVE